MQFLGGTSQLIVSTSASGGIGLLYVYIPEDVSSLVLSGIAQRSIVSMTQITFALETRPADSASSPVSVDSVVFPIGTELGAGEELAPFAIELTPAASGMHRITAIADAGLGAVSGFMFHGE